MSNNDETLGTRLVEAISFRTASNVSSSIPRAIVKHFRKKKLQKAAAAKHSAAETDRQKRKQEAEADRQKRRAERNQDHEQRLAARNAAHKEKEEIRVAGHTARSDASVKAKQEVEKAIFDRVEQNRKNAEARRNAAAAARDRASRNKARAMAAHAKKKAEKKAGGVALDQNNPDHAALMKKIKTAKPTPGTAPAPKPASQTSDQAQKEKAGKTLQDFKKRKGKPDVEAG